MVPLHNIWRTRKKQDTCKKARKCLLITNRKGNKINYPYVVVNRFSYKYVKENRGNDGQNR